MRCVRCEVKKISFDCFFVFSLSTALFFCFFSRKRLLVFAAFEFFLNNNTCEIHSHAIVEKKKKRVSVVVSVSVVVLSSEESYINAFLFSVVALFRSIDDDEEF